MLLIKPYLGCNLACKYCYENNYRQKHRPKMTYDLKAILKRMDEFKDLEISLHGGEILTLPKKDVETLLAKIYELKGQSSIQTNATLINDNFIKMFKKYKTHIGVSWDGPNELSAYRPRSKKVYSIIKRLVQEGIPVSTIIVVSKANAGTNQRLKKLKKYLLELNQMKIEGRLNPCYGYHTSKYELSIKKLKDVYLELAEFCLKNNLKWSPFNDIMNGLQGKDRVCTFMGCDPFHTPSATVILGDGSITNCMRINKEYILLRHPAQYKTRDEILENVPQEYGGCRGCKYWTACHGGCPSGAINNDWRNRTYICSAWKALFQFYENVLNHCDIPVVLGKSQQQPVEQSTYHGDSGHGDAPHGDHGDAGHGDAPHGDSHGDSGHGDSYGDSGYGDSYGSHANLGHRNYGHGDAPHGNSHGDR